MLTAKNTDNPTPYSYWVLKNRFLAGEYPGSHDIGNPFRKVVSKFYALLASIKNPNKGWYSSKLRYNELISSGITSFVDLTEENELPEYQTAITELSIAKGIGINYKRMPIPDMDTPSTGFLSTILDYIDYEISQGKNVYVHCFRGLGRTGTIVGCYLVRHGKSGEESLAEIFNLRRGVLNSWLASPQTDKQRDFVLNWKDSH